MFNQVKVVMIGYAGVGKTSITTRFTSDSFESNTQSTLGAAFSEKLFNHGQGKNTKFQIWDTAGQEKFKAIAKIYYRDAKVAIIVYDVSSRQSFDSMKLWMQELKDKGPQNVILAIVGNKIDLLKQQVTIQQAQQYAKANQAILKFTSAKQDKGIKQLFNAIALQIENIKIIKRNTTSLQNHKTKPKGDCQC